MKPTRPDARHNDFPVTERSIWMDQLSDDELGALEPGLPAALARRPDVLVVGGGILGVATAVACQDAGLGSVLLIEATRLGHFRTGILMGPSTGSLLAGWISTGEPPVGGRPADDREVRELVTDRAKPISTTLTVDEFRRLVALRRPPSWTPDATDFCHE